MNEAENHLERDAAPAQPVTPQVNLPVTHLFTMELALGRSAYMPDGPHGARLYAPVEGGTVRGDRINATVMPGADWVTVRADGFANIDVRLALQTDDECVVFMEYRGILDVGPERRPRTGVLFQAGAERYRWLNNVLAIGIGTPGRHSVSYEVYAVL